MSVALHTRTDGNENASHKPGSGRTSQKKSHLKAALLVAPGVIALAITFLFPLVLTIRMSLNSASQTGVIQDAFGFSSYAKALSDPYYWSLIARTLGLGLTVAIFTVVVPTRLPTSLAEQTPGGRDCCSDLQSPRSSCQPLSAPTAGL